MRERFKVVTLLLLCVGLLAAYGMASPPAGPPSAPLGVVESADNPHAGVDRMYAGATIYDGDHLATQDESTMRLRLASGRLLLLKDSAVTVHSIPNGFSADLDNGTVSASSPEGQTFQLLVNGITIRPATSQATSLQIAKVSPTEATLISTRGNLLVSLEGEVKTVSAGNSYRLEVETEEAAGNPQGRPPIAAGRNRHVLGIVIIGAIAGVTAYAIWRAVESPSSPQ